MARRKKLPVEENPEFEPTSTAVEEQRAAPADSGDSMVTVALNRAQGIQFALSGGRKITVAGNAVHLRGRDMGILPTGGAFGLTAIKKSDWEEIRNRYGRTALFKSGRIFASRSRFEALAEAREKADTRNGLEPASGKNTESVTETVI